MKSTQPTSASSTGAVIVGLVILAGVVFAGLRLKQTGDRVDLLESELSTAETRLEELQNQVNAERTARQQAEATAKEAGNAAVQARQEMESETEKLNGRIGELEFSVREYEQKMAMADEMRMKAEAELARETELRKSVEQEITDVRSQLQQQEALVSQLQRPATTTPADAAATAGAGTGARGASSVAKAEPDARATSAAKQSFPAEETTSAGAGAAFDTPPRPIDLVSPQYPQGLRRQGTEGHVVVSFTVDTRGRVQDVEVREATNPEFGDAAVDAVRKWRFKPATRDGESVEVRISQRLDFNND